MHLGKPTIALLLIPSLALAQTAPTPTIKITTREVIVDIIATDAHGDAIRNLKQSDFTIFEDGKPQPLRSFNETGTEPALKSRTAPTLPSGVRSNLQATSTGGPVNIILIDALHLNFAGTARSMQAVAAYSAAMPQGTQLAVFWLGASGMHMIQAFTTDREAIQQALSTTRTDIGTNRDCYGTDRLTIDALNQIATYVAGIKGRKNLIWVTPGIPVFLLRDGGYSWGTSTACHDVTGEGTAFGQGSRDGYSLFTGPDGTTTDGLDMGMVHRIMDTYEIFSSEQIAVSPLDPSGVGRLGGSQLVAEQVAEQSGGIAAYNNNDLTSMFAQIVNKSAHYYSISYVPPHKDDAHYHTIKVQLDIPGAHLIYRVGYNAEDPKQPREFSGPDLIKAALEGKTPAASQLVFDAKLSPASAAELASAAPPPPAKAKGKPLPPRTTYDLYLAVPQRQITYTKSPDGSRIINLQFAFDAYDLNGKLLGSHTQNVARTIPLDDFAQFALEPVIFHEQLAFFPGPLFLRVGILDHTSNKVGTIEIPLTVPKK